MTRTRVRLRLGAALAFALLTLGSARLLAVDRSSLSGSFAECREGEVGLFIPAFEGSQPLGLQVATVLNLQIWQTLRRVPGSPVTGVVVWDHEPLAEPSFESAEQQASERGCQLVFWGRVWRYGDDVVAQTYLSILDPRPLWRVEIDSLDGTHAVELGFPRHRYEFAPIVLRSELVEQFSQPSALELRSRSDGGDVLGTLGAEFSALEQGADVARVMNADGRDGWVQLPQLSRERSEVVDFTGGVIRMLRGDWPGAADLFDRVSTNSVTPSALEIDSLLLRGVASANRSENGGSAIEDAQRLNRHSAISTRYLMMKHLSRLAERQLRGESGEREREALERTLAQNRHLFATDDAWIEGVHSTLTGLR